ILAKLSGKTPACAGVWLERTTVAYLHLQAFDSSRNQTPGAISGGLSPAGVQVQAVARFFIRAAPATTASRNACQSACVVSQPALKRSMRSVFAGSQPIASNTCEGCSLPLAQAEPVETAKPSLSSCTTQRRRQSLVG